MRIGSSGCFSSLMPRLFRVDSVVSRVLVVQLTWPWRRPRQQTGLPRIVTDQSRIDPGLWLLAVLSPMAILPVTLKEIAAQVRSGFEERDRIIEIFCEEMYEPGELDPSEVELAVDAAFADLEAEKGSWPEVTDCDRLDAAF